MSCVFLFTVFFFCISRLSHYHSHSFPSRHWLACIKPRLTAAFVAPCVFASASQWSGGTYTAPFPIPSSQNRKKKKKTCLPPGWSLCWASKRRKEQVPHYRHLWRAGFAILERDKRSREKSPPVLGKNTQQGGGKWWDVKCMDSELLGCRVCILWPLGSCTSGENEGDTTAKAWLCGNLQNDEDVSIILQIGSFRQSEAQSQNWDQTDRRVKSVQPTAEPTVTSLPGCQWSPVTGSSSESWNATEGGVLRVPGGGGGGGWLGCFCLAQLTLPQWLSAIFTVIVIILDGDAEQQGSLFSWWISDWGRL